VNGVVGAGDKHEKPNDNEGEGEDHVKAASGAVEDVRSYESQEDSNLLCSSKHSQNI
jgi:hypothetical protein